VPVDEFEGEIGRSFELIRRTSKAVSQAHSNASFPIVLAGNCSATVGVAAGSIASPDILRGEKLGCVWFDAHDDYNTPDTVMSGYFDSQCIAMLAGECWKGLLGTVPGHSPMNLRESLIHVGMRDVNDLERQRVLEAGFDVVWGNVEEKVDFAKSLGGRLNQKKLGPTMVHLDVDSLDVSLGKANQFAVPGGLFEKDLEGCLNAILKKTRPVSLTVASFDPSLDKSENLAAITIKAVTNFLKGLIDGRDSNK
jgi:arginase